jgi:chromosome segregation ATPase
VEVSRIIEVPNQGGPIVIRGPGVTRTVPRSAQELAGLREQRRELSNQLTSAQGRRRDVAKALERARDPVNQNGLQQRLQVLDVRIAQLETDISETGRLITTASPALVSQVARRELDPFGDRGPPASVVAIVFIIFAIFPLILAFSRAFRRRAPMTRPDPVQRETAERLARMEQAVEAIAIEVERVSEGQRFVTRLLSESRQAPALAGANATLDVVPRQG